jgi:hypothetical protein
MTAQALDVLNLFVVFRKFGDITALRKRCRALREKFSFLSISLDVENARHKTDPELLFLALTNGVSLNSLVEAIRKPFSEITDASANRESGVSTETPSVLISSSATTERLTNFESYCLTALEMKKDTTISPHILRQYSAENGIVVISSLEKFFETPVVQRRLAELEEHYKRNRLKTDKFRSATGSSLTPDDLRRKVIDEFMSTEQSYVKDLEKLLFSFVAPLKERISFVPTSETISVEQEVLSVFVNIDALTAFHKTFLAGLEKLTSIDHVGNIGDLVVENGDKMIQLYEVYCSQHSDSLDRLPDLKGHNEVMAILMMTGEPSADQLAKRNLSSQLIKPVQRIMRYHLLLKEMLKYTPKEHEGYERLEKGLNKAKEIASAINEIKRRKENEQKLTILQGAIEGYDVRTILVEQKSLIFFIL